MFRRVLAALGLALCAAAAMAQDDPALEARVSAIASELRCLVCQNQTIADSHAELATDLKREIRNKLRQGQSQQEILAFMTQRYGDFVLYRPPLKATTAVLWAGPAVLLLAGVLVLLWVLRRRARLGADAFEPDTPDDDARPPAA